ncbi:MAG: MFS transporter [Candidatus Hydrogenedentota bacterium]
MSDGVRPNLKRGLTREQHIWRWKVLIATYIGYAGYYLTRKVFGIVKTSLADPETGLGIELHDTAHIWTAFLVAYMIGQFVNSFVGRKWGPRLLLLGGLGLSIVCNVIFGFTNSYYTFLVFMFFNGLFQASGWPGVVGGISEWLRPMERGSIMGVWTTSYLIGNMLVKAIGGYMLHAYGWRWAFFGCTLLSVGVWLLIYFWQRNKPADVGLDPIVYEHDEDDVRAIRASQEEQIPLRDYMHLALNPLVIAMGLSYFCIKFLRYALDSWLPAFLNIQGMAVDHAAYYSSVFDIAGLPGAILAGLALDWIFRGNWAALCFTMGLGMVGGYLLVVFYGSNPYALAFSFALVGFMMYGPDTILCGAGAVTVAGERNGVALAGLVNGFGSIGAVVQEEVIGLLVKGDPDTGIRNTNILALAMSILFVVLMVGVMWRVSVAHRNNESIVGP